MTAPQQIVGRLLEDEVNPQDYIDALPFSLEINRLVKGIMREAPYCMDVPEEKQNFLNWLDNNSQLLPDLERAKDIITANQSWCFDNVEDVALFISMLTGKVHTENPCERCDGTGDDPNDVGYLCPACYGWGYQLISDLGSKEPTQ
jgi:hypothetical protein